MNILRKFKELRSLSARASAGAAAFSLFNSLCHRLGLKMKHGLPIRLARSHSLPMYLRAGTTDWITCEITLMTDEYAFVPRLLPRVESILDLGANIGDSARYFAAAYPNAKIVALEPDAGNIEMCRKNVALMLAGPRIVCKQCFVGASSGQAGIDRSGGEWAYSMKKGLTGQEQIRVVTIAELLPEFGGGGVDLLKCDIEGAEQELFADCSAWIKKVRHIAIETSPPYGVSALEKDLERNGAKFRKLHHSAPDGYHELALFSRCGEE